MRGSLFAGSRELPGGTAASQRVEKENAIAEKFWMTRAGETGGPGKDDDAASQASGSTAFTGFSSKTSYLKTKMAALEELLMQEKGKREQLEQDIKKMRASAEKPATPQATA